MTAANFKRYFLPLEGDTQDDAWVAPRSGTPRNAWFCDAEADLPTGADAASVVNGDWAFALSEGTFWKRETGSWTQIQSGSGAPTDADYLIGTSNPGLSAEIVVGTTPGGELGNTWASPTVDATHSGSSHAGVISTHEGLADPHTGYVLESVAIPFSISFVISNNGSAIPTGIWPVWKALFACTVTGVQAYTDTGTTTVVNAGTGTPPEASDEDFCSADITIDPADAWEVGTVNQNQAVSAGETISVEVKTAGTATQCTIQIDLTRP